MTEERWRQVKTIFDGAVECDPAARADFVRRACEGDQELFREVERLLASDGEFTSRFREPVLGAAAIAGGSGAGAALVFKERYEVERELGRGGMSVVYLARDRQLLAKNVVVKVLLAESDIDPWMRQKFLQEMEALSRIDHPGVVGVLDTGVTPDGKQFLVMQYIEGSTLRAAIQAGGMKFTRAAGLIRQIGQALAAAHEKGVWHRDLKPENIMLQSLGGQDHVRLIDFGIAGIQDSKFTGEKTKIAGSLAYMAPEQLSGQACAASDTYALAVVAYEILTGALPPRVGESRPVLPEAVERPIFKSLSYRPEQRHSGVREFSEELYHALSAGEPAHRPVVPGGVEMAHVLFTDLVGYSLLPMDQQKEYLGELQEIVRESAQFRTAEANGDIISLPTGDGMALAFFGDPTAPAQCALEVAARLKTKPYLKLRMGINSGPVYRVSDVNANATVAGGGINLAQRVMDCGNAGDILMSKTVADMLGQLSQWSPYLTDLGERTVKHGVKVHLCSLATADLGNRQSPRRTGIVAPRTRKKAAIATALALLVFAAAAGGWWLVRGRGTQDQPSIAVLPFRDLSPEKNQEFFSEGLAEELLNALAKIKELRVAGRSSSFQFAGKSEDSREIGKKLHVGAILEGSVRQQSKQARINVELIQAANGFQLWADTYDTDLNDILAVQERIAQAVTGALKVKLLKKTAPVPAKPTIPDAYKAYLQGRYFLERHNGQENLEKANHYFDEATKLDPKYAKAWVGLGEARNGLAAAGFYTPQEEGFRLAREAVNRALVLDADLGEAHSALGWIQMLNDFDWMGADSSFKRALALAPGDATVVSHAGILARILGRFDEAATLGRQGIQIDPLRSGVYQNAGVSFYYAGQYDEAANAYHKALELVPDLAIAHCLLGQVYLAQSRPQEALAEMEKEKRTELRLFGLALAYHALGRKKESDANLNELVAKFDGPPYQVAEAYAYRGEKDRAFKWLEKAYAQRGVTQLKGDPLLKSLESDPRYAALLEKMHLPVGKPPN